MFAGVVITAIDMIFPHQFSTILEVDYDTPYDRHVIIEESFDTRNIRRRPKIEDSFGDRIIRFYSNSYIFIYCILTLLRFVFSIFFNPVTDFLSLTSLLNSKKI